MEPPAAPVATDPASSGEAKDAAMPAAPPAPVDDPSARYEIRFGI
jgi:hypothetical protein